MATWASIEYPPSSAIAGTAVTRPANTDAYAALDSISNNATAGSVTALVDALSAANNEPIDLFSVLLVTGDTGPGTAGAIIRLHLFNSDPTLNSGVVGGDNAAWSNKQAGWLGSLSGPMTLFSDGSRGVLTPDSGLGFLTCLFPGTNTGNFWHQLQTLSAFTPSANSTIFTPTFRVRRARS